MTQGTVTLTFLGAAGTVTGSKYLLRSGNRTILVDAGVFQGEKEWRAKNWEPFPVNPSAITDILITHGHTDHIGYLPALVAQGFNGPIYTTGATVALGEIVLRDAGKLQEQQARDAKEGGWSKHADPKPLFTLDDVEATLPLMRPVDFDTDVDLGDGLTARWTRAAHVLGSASIRLTGPDGADVLFSGDLGRHDHPVLKPRATPRGARTVLMESTYGDREHPEPAIPHEPMMDAINRTIARGGSVVIPAFAIDRTETVLQALTAAYREGRIPDVPVFVDSPMALAALELYTDPSLGEMREDITVEDFMGMPTIRGARSSDESKAINKHRKPCIIVSSSGMAEGGRVLHHLARLLPDERNCVILTGFQANGTRGRALEEGAEHVKINGRYIPVKAEIVRDHEFSVHGDRSDLLDWAHALDPKPEIIYVVHGEPQVAEGFAATLRQEIGCMAVVPRYGEVVALTPGAEDPEDLDVDVPPAPTPGTEVKE